MSKTPILQCSDFFMVQLSHPFMTAGKSIALTKWTFIGNVMSLLFNIMSKFVIAFLPRTKFLNFRVAVTIWSDFGAQENKVCQFPLFPYLGATPCPRSGGCARCRRAERSYSTFKVRRGSCEEIPLVQGKEQWLRFAGAAVKRYSTSKVRETQVRQ